MRSLHRRSMRYFERDRARLILGVVSAWTWTLAAAAPALAHDPPEVAHIEFLSGSPNTAVFQTARAFVIGDTQTRSYRWACIDGLQLELGEQPSFVALPDNSWLVATQQGLKKSPDEGCTWSPTAQFGSS